MNKVELFYLIGDVDDKKVRDALESNLISPKSFAQLLLACFLIATICFVIDVLNIIQIFPLIGVSDFLAPVLCLIFGIWLALRQWKGVLSYSFRSIGIYAIIIVLLWISFICLYKQYLLDIIPYNLFGPPYKVPDSFVALMVERFFRLRLFSLSGGVGLLLCFTTYPIVKIVRVWRYRNKNYTVKYIPKNNNH